MSARRALATALALVAWTAAFATVASASHAADATPALSAATAPASWGAVLLPGYSAAPPTDAQGRPCRNAQTGRRGYYSDVQAYRWTRAGWQSEGRQRWDSGSDVAYWRHAGAARRRVVYFDGYGFTNRTRHPVLVAGWCDQ